MRDARCALPACPDKMHNFVQIPIDEVAHANQRHLLLNGWVPSWVVGRDKQAGPQRCFGAVCPLQIPKYILPFG
jgi:hypothetical protein